MGQPDQPPHRVPRRGDRQACRGATIAKGSLSAKDQRLLRDLAREAGVAVHALQLTDDLRRSRERLVTGREEERRRLRRDLHDGLGPTPAAISLGLDTTRRLAHHDAVAADAMLGDVASLAQQAVGEIRRIANDLRPASLDQLGLLNALREHAARIGTSAGGGGAPFHRPPQPSHAGSRADDV